MINQFVIDRVNVRKNFEAGVLNKIQKKVDIIRQNMNSQKTQRVLTDHYEGIVLQPFSDSSVQVVYLHGFPPFFETGGARAVGEVTLRGVYSQMHTLE